MADQNQSPGSQPSVTLSGLVFPVVLAGSPLVEPFPPLSLNVGSPSVAINFGGGGPSGPSVPTVGQIWPLGLIPCPEPPPCPESPP
jgi:hypothetical protein